MAAATYKSTAAKWRYFDGSWITATTAGNYAPALAVGYTGGKHTESYWKFDLSPLKGRIITKATLRLYLKHRYGENPIYLTACSSISGSTGAYDLGSDVSAVLTGSGWKSIDVTGIIESIIEGGYVRAYGKATSGIYHDFATQSSYPAQLEVEYLTDGVQVRTAQGWKPAKAVYVNTGGRWEPAGDLMINIQDKWK